jgi:hypothetical protein
MHSCSPPEAGWDALLILALSIEAAYVAENWLEFGQLCRQRSETLQRLKSSGVPQDPDVVRRIETVDARVVAALQARRREVSANLRRLAAFRRSQARI